MDRRSAGVFRLEEFDSNTSLWRYRCPLQEIEDLQHVGSKYSPEFRIGGVPWRIHLQQRVDPQTQQVYLAVHLQCLTQNPTGTYGHFKLSVCNIDPDKTKSKNFHCHFKKSGSAWGLHHFILMDRLLHPDGGFIDYGDDETGRKAPSSAPCVIIDALVRVIEPGSDGSYTLGTLPRSSKGFPSTEPPHRPAPPPQTAYGRHHDPVRPEPIHIKASLQYPYDDSLCDMSFDVEGRYIKAHRCIVAARVPKLISVGQDPLPQGVVISIAVPSNVFDHFLRYVYTEEAPEPGILQPEALLDLYMLAMDHEFYLLAEHCINLVTPLLTYENILPIVLTRYNAADEILSALYLRVLASGYDHLIEEENFERIPGVLNRRLSLIVRGKENPPTVILPKMRNSLSAQLAILAESGAYSDFDIKLAEGTSIKGHKFVLGSRSVVLNHAFYRREAIPDFSSSEFTFSVRAWQKVLIAIYRGSLEVQKEFAAEDVALVWKLNDALTLDGSLRAETESCVTSDNALRLLIYAEKHSVAKLRDLTLRHVSHNFAERVRRDPHAWDIIAELPQTALLSLFRTVVEMNH